MRLTMLGTGNALVTECYNTCFVLNEKDRYLLVDGGGGSALLGQLKHSGIDWKDIKRDFCKPISTSSSDGDCLDDSHDLSAYEARTV